jgi:hypothetical protein
MDDRNALYFISDLSKRVSDIHSSNVYVFQVMYTFKIS